MSTEYPEIFAALAAPFDSSEVKVRKHDNAHYITARSVQNRLDAVLGPENWWPKYTPWGADSVYCEITLRLPDGREVTKGDIGACSSMAEKAKAGAVDEGDDDKGGASDALKRAGVAWGVGRYLYRVGVPQYRAQATQPPSQGPQPAPSHAPEPRDLGWVHNPDQGREREPAAPAVRTNVNGRPHGDPRNGKALWAWAKEQEQLYEVGLVNYLVQWARLQGYPPKMYEWGRDQVEAGLDEARRKLQQLGASRTHADAEPEPEREPAVAGAHA